MISSGLTVVFVALFPLLLIELLVPERMTWAISSALMVDVRVIRPQFLASQCSDDACEAHQGNGNLGDGLKRVLHVDAPMAERTRRITG